MAQVHEKFDSYLKKLGLKTGEVANRVKRNRLTIQRWRNGKSHPDADAQALIEEHFGFVWRQATLPGGRNFKGKALDFTTSKALLSAARIGLRYILRVERAGTMTPTSSEDAVIVRTAIGRAELKGVR